MTCSGQAVHPGERKAAQPTAAQRRWKCSAANGWLPGPVGGEAATVPEHRALWWVVQEHMDRGRW